MADVIGPIIAKQGTITILKSVPWDNSYRHVLMPVSEAGQYNQITQGGSNIVVSNLGAQSYSRVSNNVVRIQVSADKIKHCNYMVINNGAGFGHSKNFYCFITNVEYVNVNTCDVTFELDYFQTYYFDFVFEDSYIEREHSATDEIGDNLIPEDLATGDLIVQGKTERTSGLSQTMYTVVVYVPNLDSEKPYIWYDGGEVSYQASLTSAQLAFQRNPAIRNRLGAGTLFCPIDTASLEAIEAAVKGLNKYTNTIVAMYQITQEMYQDMFSTHNTVAHDYDFAESALFKGLNRSNDYTPANKKLYQYPFRRLIMSNNNGQTNELKWELFSERSNSMPLAEFAVLHAMTPPPKSYSYPRHYRSLIYDYENGCTIDDFPMLSWSEDSFAKWWGQNKANFGISVMSSILSTGMMLGGVGGLKNIASEGLSARNEYTIGMGVNRIAGLYGQYEKAKATPDAVNIQDNSAIINIIEGRFGYTIYDVGVTGEMAKIIDDYFTMYGYACNRVKQPNFKSEHRRRYFNYIKTKNCCLQAQTGSYRGLPSEAQNLLEKMFDNGVTVWTDYDKVGDYETYKFSNDPIG